MGQRYHLPFRDKNGVLYELRIGVDGYNGESEELIGKRSPFTVTVDDDDFIYKPVRMSTAVLSLLERDIRTDLFSLNDQYASIKLYRGNALFWTGYIKPEQYTQPYIPNPAAITVDCVSPITTLENMRYEHQTVDGVITVRRLLAYLLSSAGGGYVGVNIPEVYGNDAASLSILDQLTVIEDNFDEMNMLEVLEALMKFFSWTLWDTAGELWIIDPDWFGTYAFCTFDQTTITKSMDLEPRSITLQNIGFAGSDHSLDIIRGYNKVTVRSVNKVFDQILEREDYEKDRIAYTIKGSKGNDRVTDNYVIPTKWETFCFDKYGHPVQYLDLYPIDERYNQPYGPLGGTLLRRAEYSVQVVDGVEYPVTPDYNWTDSVRSRALTGTVDWEGEMPEPCTTPILKIKGPRAFWADCAFSISSDLRITAIGDQNPWMMFPNAITFDPDVREIKFSLRVGDRWWNGTNWVTTQSSFMVKAIFTTPTGSITNTKSPEMPYPGLSGYLIPVSGITLIGDFELTLYDTYVDYIFRNLQVNYAKRAGIEEDGEDGDRIYENVISEANKSEMDEVVFDIGSYNNDGATYSKVMLNGSWLTDNLYSEIEHRDIRPEEGFIRRACGRYEMPQMRLTQQVRFTEFILPNTILYDRTVVNKQFQMMGYVWDVQRARMNLTMVENGN